MGEMDAEYFVLCQATINLVLGPITLLCCYDLGHLAHIFLSFLDQHVLI